MRTHVIITINVLVFSIFCVLFSVKLAGYQLDWLDVLTPLILLCVGHAIYQVVRFFGVIIVNGEIKL